MRSLMNFLVSEPSYKYGYVIYSYKEGILDILQVITAVSIIALISVIISLILGIRKKDCVAILVANIMVKTIVIFLCQILYNFLYLEDFYIVILFLIATVITVIVEGLIYIIVFKYKKHNGMVVSTICNIGTVIIYILFIYYFLGQHLLY